MKKLLLTIGFIGCTVASALAQGTIAFGNSALTRITVHDSPGNRRNLTVADGVMFGAFYGPAGSTQDQLVMAPGIATIGPVAGILINAPSVFALPGTEPGQVVSLQIRAWNDQGWWGQTKVAQVTLGPTAGPGTVIWQTSDTNPNRFTLLHIIPEPSSITIGLLGAIVAVLTGRKATRKSN